MTDIVIQKNLRFGSSKENNLPAHVELTIQHVPGECAHYRVVMSAPIPIEKTLKASDPFDALRLGLAGIRQVLRHFQRQNPDTRYFDEIDGKLVEQSVDDIFWTHDCVPGT